jgi:nitrogen permease regulator 3-like protein
MTMFNVVFVLNPPALEYQLRVKDMYDNVTRKYAKTLKYEEARFQYVWKESKRIINIKQRAKENGQTLSTTWREIINTSPLARSIAILFDAISNDKIAHIQFDATFNTSFEIPQPDSTPYLPNALEPQMPGLWLTTSNVLIDDDNGAPMTQHAALLLLEDPETLVKELESDAKGNATQLAFYIRTIVPTKSLQKIAIKHNILAQDMEYISRHLVYWRRARLIAPLHPRDTYIVSPNADMSALSTATSAYAARFPTLPSLAKMLNLLSGTPRSYRTFIPTNEHRERYMEILAWLMRGGWVTQLRTFAWVRVTPEIKALVAQDMSREAQLKKAEDARRDTDIDSQTESPFSDKRSSFLSAGRPSTPLRRSARREDEEDSENGRILSPRSAYRTSPARPASDAGSTTSNRTTIALSSARPTSPNSQARPHRPSPLHLKTVSPSRAPFSPISPSLSHANNPPSPPLPHQLTASLVLSPQRANSLEARWLEKIGQSFEDAEIREHWPMLLRHLDGKHALEDINPREGIKRKKVEALLRGIREGGWLVVVRHW